MGQEIGGANAHAITVVPFLLRLVPPARGVERGCGVHVVNGAVGIVGVALVIHTLGFDIERYAERQIPPVIVAVGLFIR